MYLFIYVLYQIVQHYSKAQQTWSLKKKIVYLFIWKVLCSKISTLILLKYYRFHNKVWQVKKNIYILMFYILYKYI